MKKKKKKFVCIFSIIRVCDPALATLEETQDNTISVFCRKLRSPAFILAQRVSPTCRRVAASGRTDVQRHARRRAKVEKGERKTL